MARPSSGASVESGMRSTNAIESGMKKRTNAAHHVTGDPLTITTLIRRLRIPKVWPVRAVDGTR